MQSYVGDDSSQNLPDADNLFVTHWEENPNHQVPLVCAAATGH